MTEETMRTSAHHSLPLGSNLANVLNLLDTAAEQVMVHTDFQAAFDTCERGLAILVENGKEDSRLGELKAGLCILGIQVLAELDQWQGVLSWLIHHYEQLEEIPAKIMQMCILLYTKVRQEAMIKEAARLWLSCAANSAQACYRTVAELYLLYVLLPLGHTDEARQFILGEGGSSTLSEDHRQVALDLVKEKELQSREPPLNFSRSPSPEITALTSSQQGALVKLKAMLSVLYRRLSTTSFRCFPLRRLFVAAVILYILLVRIDPAFPSSYLWIVKLLHLLKQMWNKMFNAH